jgi:hypothetical protein
MPKRVGKAKQATWAALTKIEKPKPRKQAKPISWANWSTLPGIFASRGTGKSEFVEQWMNKMAVSIKDEIDWTVLNGNR